MKGKQAQRESNKRRVYRRTVISILAPFACGHQVRQCVQTIHITHVVHTNRIINKEERPVNSVVYTVIGSS